MYPATTTPVGGSESGTAFRDLMLRKSSEVTTFAAAVCSSGSIDMTTLANFTLESIDQVLDEAHSPRTFSCDSEADDCTWPAKGSEVAASTSLPFLEAGPQEEDSRGTWSEEAPAAAAATKPQKATPMQPVTSSPDLCMAADNRSSGSNAQEPHMLRVFSEPTPCGAKADDGPGANKAMAAPTRGAASAEGRKGVHTTQGDKGDRKARQRRAAAGGTSSMLNILSEPTMRGAVEELQRGAAPRGAERYSAARDDSAPQMVNVFSEPPAPRMGLLGGLLTVGRRVCARGGRSSKVLPAAPDASGGEDAPGRSSDAAGQRSLSRLLFRRRGAQGE